MRLLFLHQNFPGQWVHLANHYGNLPDHQVVAITDKVNVQPEIVRTLRYEVPPSPLQGMPEAISRFGHNYIRGQAVARVMAALKDEGFEPDVVIGHCGWGETLFVKEIWPDTKLLIYGEFYYRSEGLDVNFDPEFPEAGPMKGKEVLAYNSTFTLSAANADMVLTPTFWQRDSFPKKFHSQMTVIHDGIDTDRVKPNPKASVFLGRDKVTLTPADEVITFIARNLEPYRGYHILTRALPEIMARRPKARVIVIGGDQVSYGRPPPPGLTWKQVFLTQVGKKIDFGRLHLVGRVPHRFLWDALGVSTCHIYLTYPFVLSWSMLEAMAMECLVVGSATPPVQEVIKHGSNGLLVDFFDPGALAETVIDAVEHRERYLPYRAAARRTVVERYDLHSKSLPRLTRLIEGMVVRPKLKMVARP